MQQAYTSNIDSGSRGRINPNTTKACLCFS